MPFAGYNDWDECISRNRDKDSPEKYCGSIKHRVEDKAMNEVVDQGAMRSRIRRAIAKASVASLELATEVFKAGASSSGTPMDPREHGGFVGDQGAGGRTYLAPGEQAPPGVQVQQGERGGKYYEGSPRKPKQGDQHTSRPAHDDPSEQHLYQHAPKQPLKPQGRPDYAAPGRGAADDDVRSHQGGGQPLGDVPPARSNPREEGRIAEELYRDASPKDLAGADPGDLAKEIQELYPKIFDANALAIAKKLIRRAQGEESVSKPGSATRADEDWVRGARQPQRVKPQDRGPRQPPQPMEGYDPRSQQKVPIKPVGRPHGANSVRVDTNAYMGSHGKKPKGTGGWAFSFGERNGPYKFYRGTHTQAARQAQQDAGRLGYWSVHTQP